MVDLLLIAALGFFGSFGHCVGMCGPIAAAFSLSASAEASRQQQLRFHLTLNLGRLLSYALVGATVGGLGSVLVAGGQVAGVGSPLRRGIALLTGTNYEPHTPLLKNSRAKSGAGAASSSVNTVRSGSTCTGSSFGWSRFWRKKPVEIDRWSW